MDGLDHTGSPPRRPRLLPPAIVAAVLLAAGALAQLSWQALDRDAAFGWLPALVLTALAGATAAGWLGLGWMNLGSQLRQARADAVRLRQLLPGWHWHSDAEHRVTQWRASRPGAPDDATATPLGRLLWDGFGSDAAALRAQLDAHLPLCDLPALRTLAAGDTRAGRLCAQARLDDTGAFVGYEGTWTEDALQAAAAPLAAAPPAAEAAGEPVAETVAPAAATVPGELDADRESFSYTVSHDLRAPIRVVEGFTKIVKEDYGRLLDRVGNDHLDRVLGAAARMNSMIDALLALSKLSSQPLARQPVNLTQLAGYVTEDLRRQWPERLVVLHIEPGMQVLGDPTLLRVALENLLGNAWKYSSKCREAKIWFERHPGEPRTFTVRDNGAGFDMRFSDRLFGVFQRLHSANDFQGTGVGLASVRRIIRRHGGEIWAEAEVGRGASFHFSLPQG